jgi:hypothetical protein
MRGLWAAIHRRHQTGDFPLSAPNLILIERALGLNAHANARLAALGQSGAIGGGAGTGAGLALYEHLGLMPFFDGFGGSSSGNVAMFAASGQAVDAALAFTGEVNTPELLNPYRYLTGMLDTRWLYHRKMADPAARCHLDTSTLLSPASPNFKGDLFLTATCPATGEPVTLNNFRSDTELRDAMVTTAYLPGLIDGPHQAFTRYRGRDLLDGAFSDPTAIRAAKKRGFTHAVIFSGHADGDRAPSKLSLVEQNHMHLAFYWSGLTPIHAYSMLSKEFTRRLVEGREQIEHGTCEGIVTATCSPPRGSSIATFELDSHKLFRHMRVTFNHGAMRNFGLRPGHDLDLPDSWMRRLDEMSAPDTALAPLAPYLPDKAELEPAL